MITDRFKYNPDNLTEDKLWGLGLCAIFAEKSHNRHDILYGNVKSSISEKHINKSKEGLKNNWKITDRESFLKALDNILEEGFGVNFKSFRDSFTLLPEHAKDGYINNIARESNKHLLHKIIKTYDKKLPKAGIAAYDYEKCINLCRAVSYIGYIEEEELWKCILKVSRLAQSQYSSWEEYGLASFVGYQLATTEFNESIEDYFNIYKKLLVDKKSPWVRNSWNTKLD